MPMSSPSRTTSGIVLHGARERQVDRLDQGQLRHRLRLATACGTLARVGRRKLGVKIVEHRCGPLRPASRDAFRGGIDLLRARAERLLLLVAPHALRCDKAQAARPAPPPVRADFLGIAIARRIIGRVVVLQTIGDASIRRRAAAGARARERLGHASCTASTSLPSTCRTGCPRRSPSARASALRSALARHRDGPLVVVDDERPAEASRRRRC